MTNTQIKKILVATDFLPHSEAALKQAIWLARCSPAKIVLAHVLPDFSKAVLSASRDAQYDMIYGDGEKLQKEIREESSARMKFLITKLEADDLGIRCETLLGDPAVAIVQAVLHEGYDLVLVGTRGQAAWERFVMGSTAKRLIRLCPSPVWTVKTKLEALSKIVLAATDFSETSRGAVSMGRAIAAQSGAEFHLLHVIDSSEIPARILERVTEHTFQEQVKAEVNDRLEEFIASLDGEGPITSHLSLGIAPTEIARTADDLKVDLLVMGTIGRSGIKGVLIGNTAEKVLDNCDCSILTVKPGDYVSPIDPPFWPLHPNAKT